ncbi:hypothetical protein J437_LFUL016709 [Ladona fulva]|uniref:Uncharacterized protein n=1 Tax=Ladona fulva TaxID=123851 RepID=A0A8K0P8E5_LADFU|nr:hypothetical protein J437_LFUL016709 [Ladona fulva]
MPGKTSRWRTPISGKPLRRWRRSPCLRASFYKLKNGAESEERYRNGVKQVHGLPGADIYSDHVLLELELDIRFKKIKRARTAIEKWDLEKLEGLDKEDAGGLHLRASYPWGEVCWAVACPALEAGALEICSFGEGELCDNCSCGSAVPATFLSVVFFYVRPLTVLRLTWVLFGSSPGEGSLVEGPPEVRQKFSYAEVVVRIHIESFIVKDVSPDCMVVAMLGSNPVFLLIHIEEDVQTEEIQLAPLINQLQNSNTISNPEALQWAAEADESLARNEILTENKIIRTVTAEDDDDDDTPINSVKFLILRLWRHSIIQYSGLKSKILKHTKLCSSDV